jgi:thiamine biosynthesis lipoprotein
VIALALLHPLRGYSQKYSFVQNKLGSPFGIIVSTSDTTGMGQVINECFALVDELNMVFSDYDPNSEVGKIDKLKAHQWSRVSKPLFDLLLIAQRAYFTSYKSFDVTIGNITKEWRLAKKENRLPQKKLLSDYHKYIGADQYILDENKSLIYKKNDKFSFDFGGIAKGYIADRVGELLAERGYSRHLIDAGGDLLCGASPVNSDGWKISLHYAESEKY